MRRHGRTILLVLSMLLNAGLVVWAWRVWLPSPTSASVTQETVFITNQEALVASHPNPEPAPDGAALPAWDTFASTNLRDYATNLRAAGCPASILQAVIAAELDRRYRPALHRVYQSMDADYWDDAALWKMAEGRRQSRERLRPVGQLFEQYLAEANGLVAAGALKRANPFLREDDERPHLNFLEDQKRKRLADMEVEIDQARQSLRAQGFEESEVNRQLEVLRQEHERERRQLLTAEEYDELQLRTSRHAHFAWKLHGFEPTADEYRGIVRLLEAAGERASLDDCREPIKLLLGEQRFAEFQRARTPEFILLHRVAAAYGLPAETAVELHAQQRVAGQTAAAIRDNANLSAEDREGALQELRNATEAVFLDRLGTNGWATYVRNGGAWIGTLRPPRP